MANMTDTQTIGGTARYWLWLLFAAGIAALDLWTKSVATASLQMYQPVPVFPGLNWTLAHNPGAAFSFLADQPGWQRWFFTITTIVIMVVLLIWLWRLARKATLAALSLSLVLAGAAGNLVDRVRLGYVVDFIDVYYRNWHWPAFNIADSAITVGVILLLIDGFFVSGRASNSKD